MDLRESRAVLRTPLSDAYFSDFNREALHGAIIKSVQDKFGYTIDRQNDTDLQALMRRVYVNIVRDPYVDVKSQVSRMNDRVVREATDTVSTGILQQIVYLRDISTNPVPLPTPISTSTYGNKLPYNTKVTL
jgi:Family of unknown function (DUF5761)